MQNTGEKNPVKETPFKKRKLEGFNLKSTESNISVIYI